MRKINRNFFLNFKKVRNFQTETFSGVKDFKSLLISICTERGVFLLHSLLTRATLIRCQIVAGHALRLAAPRVYKHVAP